MVLRTSARDHKSGNARTKLRDDNMDIYEIFNNARENLKVRIGPTERDIKDGEYFNIVVEISNPPRPIFSFLKEPSYAYEDIVLKVCETPYTKPADPAFLEGYHIARSLDPSDKMTVNIPLKAKTDLHSGSRPDDISMVEVEAQLKTGDLFRFEKAPDRGQFRHPIP